MVLPNDHAKSSCKWNSTIWATKMNTIEHEICVLFRNITLGVNHHHQFLCTFCCKDLLKEVLFTNIHSSSNVNLDLQIWISNKSRWRVHLITKKTLKLGSLQVSIRWETCSFPNWVCFEKITYYVVTESPPTRIYLNVFTTRRLKRNNFSD